MHNQALIRLGFCGVVTAATAMSGLAGCALEAAPAPTADPDPAPDTEVGDPTRVLQFASTASYLWRDTTYNFTDIGTAVGRACFLAGVAGDLRPEAGGTTSAGVRINGATNHYEIYIDPNGKQLGAWARCVSAATGLTNEVSWTDGQAARNLGAVVAGRRCFLTSVSNSFPSGGTYGFKSNDDNVQIWEDGVNWWLGGSQSGHASATARCITVSNDDGHWLWIAGDPGTRQDQLAANAGGSTCLLTGVGGHFTADDWTDGAYMSYDAGLLQFYLNTKNGHRGWARCVR